MKITKLIFYLILSKYSKNCKIFEYDGIQKFNNNADLRKQAFSSQEKLFGWYYESDRVDIRIKYFLLNMSSLFTFVKKQKG